MFVRTGANLGMAVEQLPFILENNTRRTAPFVTTEYKNLRRPPRTFSLLSTSFCISLLSDALRPTNQHTTGN